MAVHWRYVGSELAFRWKRTALLIAGVALAVTLVTTLDILSRAFADFATVPFRNLGADLIVQRSADADRRAQGHGHYLAVLGRADHHRRVEAAGRRARRKSGGRLRALWDLGKGRSFP